MRKRDCCGKEGSQSLARDIELYWRQRGSKEIEAWVEIGTKAGLNQSGSANYRYDVRTNMVNGFPPDWTQEMGV